MQDMDDESTNIISQIVALQWDYRTDQAQECCEDAFEAYEGDNTEAGTVLGVSQPILFERDKIIPVSSYDVLVQTLFWVSGCIIEKMEVDKFTAVSRAVLSSHLGNADTIMHSYIDTLIGGPWSSDAKISRIILRDMMILLPQDPDTYLMRLRDTPHKYEAQKQMGFPCLGVVVLPPPKSQHARLAQAKHLNQAVEFIDHWSDATTVSYVAPTQVHIP